MSAASPAGEAVEGSGGAGGIGESSGSDLHENSIPVIQETAQVDKMAVDRGGYRITKKVLTREETVDELLRDQQVSVERRPIGRTLPVGDIPEQRYEGDVLVIPVVKEILVSEKRLVLIEEVRVTRLLGTHRMPQQITLRSEEVSIERLEADGQSDSGRS